MPKESAIESKDISGFLYAPKGWEKGNGKVKALSIGTGPVAKIAAPKPETKKTDHLASWTPEEIALGTSLYDPSAKPDYIGKKELTLLPALGFGFYRRTASQPDALCLSGVGNQDHGICLPGRFGSKESETTWIGIWSRCPCFDVDTGGNYHCPGPSTGVLSSRTRFLSRELLSFYFLMGLNMAGVFEFGTKLTGVGGELQSKKGYSGSFFSGILTTLIATPCSGPFLGTVMGYALSQKAPIAFVIFTFFALGIASPYIVLSFFPKLISKLPKPGAWMDTFKKAMSFALFATAVFFLGAFARQTGYEGMSWFLFALVIIGMAAWIYGTWGTPMQKPAKRFFIGYGLAACGRGSRNSNDKNRGKEEGSQIGGRRRMETLVSRSDGAGPIQKTNRLDRLHR